MNWGDIISGVKHAADEVVAKHPDLGDDVKHTVEDIVKSDDGKKVIEAVEGIVKDHPEVAGEVVKKLEETGAMDQLRDVPKL
jgi:2-oxo-4-hydroxy-4-carboxy--5-ureidoimidazoline (OHCU) decarboxylase